MIENIEQVQIIIDDIGLSVEDNEPNLRPWGGYFRISQKETSKFVALFFQDCKVNKEKFKLQPKILFVKPNSRLSWQYHKRRSEIWKVVHGRIGVCRSLSDDYGTIEVFDKGSIIRIEKEERHRIVGLETTAIIAEIWIHESDIPSDEDDIIRLQDDYNR